MEDNRKFATFFADAPKANGKRKIVYTERWRYFLCRVARVHIQGGD